VLQAEFTTVRQQARSQHEDTSVRGPQGNRQLGTEPASAWASAGAADALRRRTHGELDSGAHWSKLTNDDWETITGKKEHLVGHIQKRYGIAKEEAKRQVDTWSDALLDIVEASRTH